MELGEEEEEEEEDSGGGSGEGGPEETSAMEEDRCAVAAEAGAGRDRVGTPLPHPLGVGSSEVLVCHLLPGSR